MICKTNTSVCVCSKDNPCKVSKIICDDCKFVEGCVDYGWQECKKFTPTPSEPMTKLCDTCEYLRYCAKSGIEDVGCDRYKRDMTTNEEWFCSLSTEEKAKTIVCLEVNALHKWKKGLVESDVDEIKRWLKEKHE